MAPIIAGIVSTLIKNNMGKVAQAVVDKGLDYVEDKVGIKIKPEMSPEELSELKIAAYQHEEFKIEQANLNTANARDLQKAALAQDDKFSKRFVYYLAAGWSFFAAVYISAITFITIPTSSIRFVDTVLGFTLGTIVASIINYFLGSSAGSVAKNDMLKDIKK
jgi:hypothetical protein